MPGLKTAQVFMNVVVLHFPPVFSELLYNSLLNRITEYNNKACICLAKQSIFQADQLRLRGAIIKKTEKFGKNSLKCPNLNYFAIILQYYLYKKCLKLKNVPIWS